MLDRFQKLADYYRFISSSLVAMGCILMHFNLFQGVQMTPSEKAPILALCAALVFLTELLPRKTMYSPFIARISGTVISFLAAWNWMLDESGGDVASIVPPQFTLIFSLLGVLAASTLLITIMPDDSNQRKVEDKENQEGM